MRVCSQKCFFITGGWQELEQAKEAAKKSSDSADQPADDQEEQRKSEAPFLLAFCLLGHFYWRPHKRIHLAFCYKKLCLFECCLSAGLLSFSGEAQQKVGLTAARKAFEGAEEAMGGFAIGTYVKVCITNLPKEWLESLDSSRPIVLGGLNAGELQCTFMQVCFVGRTFLIVSALSVVFAHRTSKISCGPLNVLS